MSSRTPSRTVAIHASDAVPAKALRETTADANARKQLVIAIGHQGRATVVVLSLLTLMRFLHDSLIFVTICGASYFYAQSTGILENTRLKQMKSENGLILSWQPGSTDAKAKQAEVFDEDGHSIASLNILRLVPEAERVSIWDVSARPGHMIAVAAVYRKADHHLRPVPTLLLFDFSGRLLSAFALEPSREILRLAVDDKSHVWTITSSSDNKDPSTVPMVVEYTPAGLISRELLTRDKFPFHAREMQDTLANGPAFMGYDSGGLWFWLPGSTELVTISAADGRSAIVKTQLPMQMGRGSWVPMKIVHESSGRLVAQVRQDRGQGEPKISNYSWSAATGWSKLEPGSCEGGFLIGASEKGLLYLQYEQGSIGHARICKFEPQ